GIRDPLRRTPRDPVRLVPERFRGCRRSEGHSQWRPGRGRCRVLDAAVRRPATAGDLNHRQGTAVIRTHDAGSLRASDAGQTVTLAGWVATRRDHGGVTFIDLRDRSGSTQVVLREADVAHDLRNEWVVAVTGEVRKRPEGNINKAIATGEIEIVAEKLDVLNAAAPLPFQ